MEILHGAKLEDILSFRTRLTCVLINEVVSILTGEAKAVSDDSVKSQAQRAIEHLSKAAANVNVCMEEVVACDADVDFNQSTPGASAWAKLWANILMKLEDVDKAVHFKVKSEEDWQAFEFSTTYGNPRKQLGRPPRFLGG